MCCFLYLSSLFALAVLLLTFWFVFFTIWAYYSVAAIDKQKDVDKYKSYNYEYTLLKAFDDKAATDARNAAGTSGNGFAMGASARKLTAFGGSMRKMNMKNSRAQSVYIRGI